jgi:hypothetical protein
MSVTMSRQPSGPGHPRFEPHDQPSLQTDLAQPDLTQRNRWTRRILLAIVAALALATFLAGIRW